MNNFVVSLRMKWRMVILLLLARLLCSAAAVPHVFLIHEPLGVSHSMYPFRIARPFGVGEIPAFPTALINGTSVVTQADVKMRHPDGSVKHAIISFIIESLAANSTLEVSLVNTPTVAPSALLSLAEMLSDSWNFEATINITNKDSAFGVATASVSARDILASGAFQYWTKGPVATTVIVGDHNGTFDMGWNSTVSPLRPIFHVTFWHGLRLIQTRCIGEISQTMMLFDMLYDIEIYIGRAENTTLVHSQRDMPHFARSRWTRTVWSGPDFAGAAPPPSEAINIDYNVKYLIEIGALLNYNMSIGNWPTSSISSHWADWTNGNDTNSLLTLPNFAPFPYIIQGKPVSDLGLMMLMADRGDYRARVMALSIADLFGGYPIALRESDPRRTFDLLIGNTTSGLGRVVTSWARLMSWLFDYRSDNLDPLYVRYSLNRALFWPNQTGFSWSFPEAPEMGYFQYLVTGDRFYLEQLHFAAANTMLSHSYPGQRGPPGSMAGSLEYSSFALNDFCNRLAASSVTPDDMQPESRYFYNATVEFIGFLEAMKNVSSTLDSISPTKRWWASNYGQRLPENPLGVYSNSPPADIRDYSPTNQSIARTEEEKGTLYLFIVSLTAAVERGFPQALPIRQYFATKFLAQQFREVGTYHRYFSTSFVTPTQKLDKTWFKTFSESMSAFESPYRENPTLSLDTSGTTAVMTAAAAVSISDDLPYTLNSWNWVRRFILPRFSRGSFSTARRYFIIPRELPLWPASCGTPPAPEAECHGPNTWYILPETGIRPPGGVNITLTEISTGDGQTVTLAPADTVFVTGNFTIGCNSTLISQGGLFVINGSSEICGKLVIQASTSEPILTTKGCANFAQGVLSLNASSIDVPASATHADVEIARFTCRDSETLGSLEFTTSPDDCRRFQFDGDATYTAQSLSVAFQIQPCESSFPLGPVIGGVVGGVALISIVSTIVFLCHRRVTFNQESVRLKRAASLVT